MENSAPAATGKQYRSGKGTTISILIPTYNRAKYLPEAIASALAQSSQADEIIVVDDGSTDATPEIVKHFIAAGVRYIRKEHSGAPLTRNRAIAEATGEFVLWLDSDDVLLEETIQSYRDELNLTPEVDVLYGSLLIANSELEPTGEKLLHPDWYGSSDSLLATLLRSNVIPNPGTLVRRKCYDLVGAYDPAYPRAHDYEFWTRLATRGTFKRVNRPVALWRWHDSNLSAASVQTDNRYEAMILQSMLDRYSLPALFPDLPWDRPSEPKSTATAYLRVAKIMQRYDSPEKTSCYARESLKHHPLQEAADLLPHSEPLMADNSGEGSTESFLNGGYSAAPLNILLTVHRSFPDSLGGVEVYSDQLAKELAAQGHRISLLVPAVAPGLPVGTIQKESRDSYDLFKIAIKLERLTDEFQNPELAEPMRNLLAELSPDIVHCQHLIGLTLTLLEETRRANIPTLATIHDGWFACNQFHFLEGGIRPCSGPTTVDKCVNCLVERNPDAYHEKHLPDLYYLLALRRLKTKTAFENLRAVVFPTRTHQEKLIQAGYDNRHSIVQPLGMPSIDYIPPVPGNGTLRILLPGNVYPTKGQDIAIRALEHITPGSVELHIWGEEVNPSFSATLRAIIPSGHKVSFHGRYLPHEIPYILAKSDVCLIPSRSENYPLVVRESLRSGVPVLGSRIGGIPELVQDGVNGLLFEQGNPLELAEAVNRVVEQRDLLKQLRDGIQEVRGIRADARELVELYRKLCNQDVLVEVGMP